MDLKERCRTYRKYLINATLRGKPDVNTATVNSDRVSNDIRMLAHKGQIVSRYYYYINRKK
jgi:hypothetical protein